MKLREIKEMIDQFLNEDSSRRSILVLASDAEEAFTYGMGKRGDLVKLIYQMLMQDEKEEIINCLDEAFKIYMESKREKANSHIISLPYNFNKIKS